MKITKKKSGKIPKLNFGLNNILTPPRKSPPMFVMIYIGHLFFFRIQKYPKQDFSHIFDAFVKELMVLFSVKRQSTIKKCISESGGGYLWATRRKKRKEIGIYGGYGCIQIFEEDKVIELLKNELEI